MTLVGRALPATGTIEPLRLGIEKEAVLWFSTMDLYTPFMKETARYRIFADAPIQACGWGQVLGSVESLRALGIRYHLLDPEGIHCSAKHQVETDDLVQLIEVRTRSEAAS